MHGCFHYKRHCEIKAECCGTFYSCRKCHNAAVGEHHSIDRYKIREMRCLFCVTVQPVSNQCIQCHEQMAPYYCDICHFFDDDTDKSLWHCDQCGFCRVGVKDTNHEHCLQCNSCMDVGHTRHTDFMSDCSVCQESLLYGGKPCILPHSCNHLIHDECLTLCLKNGRTSCPVCSRTFSGVDKTRLWAAYDNAVVSQPMPDEYKEIPVNFLCNDCNVTSNGFFNLVAYKCLLCQGYNTVRV